MKKMNYQNVKGTQDYLPEAEAIKRKVRQTLESVFIRYGCKPLETPILNYTELLASKYAGGAEILEEMYRLTDRGERDLGLRYDLTIPFAKVVALNPNLRMPFKRYEIGKVFRDGPIKTGRFREFTQCDVDIVGVESQMAEAELMVMAIDAFKELGLDVIIQYNNRNLLTGILDVFNTPKANISKVILTLDKLEKIGLEGVVKELIEIDLPSDTIRLIQQLLLDEDVKYIEYFEQYAKNNDQLNQGILELKELNSYIKFLGMEERCEFNPFLARGLEIYTGTIYEIFLTDKTVKSSIGSGGRYDNAIAGLIGADQKFSTVGISFGLDVIYTAMNIIGKDIVDENSIDFYVIPINASKESFLVARDLRQKGFKVEVEMVNKKVGKAMDRANKESVRQVIIIGEEEVRKNQYKIKNMKTGEEEIVHFLFQKQ
ncbi:histidyl-tRNA synthetase [Bacillus pakistanensis]|uniref:Histidine--tRNA ligase n=1 Tax=Rossellomorea pakistanensis TaxID=992288 RepID=A0ABS2N767_9BACI|nr:histidine--tRNA ligase [Bacillus pakistanensis]MBM7583664.1 histidyl-tRNA synthetase [Bacillus pakistanensis]